MINKNYFSICFVTFTLFMFLFYWSKRFSMIETNDWKESSMSKYEIFISRLKQSGISNVDYIFYFFPIVNLRDGQSQRDFRSETL